jgi:hypothetical protein
MHRHVLIAHSSFIEGSHMTKNIASAYVSLGFPATIRLGYEAFPETKNSSLFDRTVNSKEKIAKTKYLRWQNLSVSV